MKNIFHRSTTATPPTKEQPSWQQGLAPHTQGKATVRLLIAMFAVLVAGGSGIFFYTKFAQAANFNFVQSTWVGGVDLITTASHYTDQSTWSKYNSSTGVTMGSTVQLTPAPFTFTDDSATSTTAAFTVNGGSFSSGTNQNTVSSGGGQVILDVQP